MTKISDIVMFACAGIHLSGGSVLGGSVAWGLFKLSYYFWTTELGSELGFAVIALAGSLLCLPVCYLGTIVPYSKKSYALTSTLVYLAAAGLLIFSAGLQSTAGISRTLRDPAVLNASMLRSMQRDAVDYNARSAFASMQLQLQCCGVESYKDWFKHRHTLPPSCCGRVADNKGGPLCTAPTYRAGCLRPAITELRGFTNSTALFCGILIMSMAITLMTVGYQLTSTALEDEKNSSKPEGIAYFSPPFAPVPAPALRPGVVPV